ncbi:hypothetical protein [Lentimicrobium sp.]|uniref:hypothetical protein n=1 Tax=Lentimicrobium sp. TaxID=2034841 RepID=UPI002B814A28|nr:hypothetical protein [Lentimicrobium sp.]HRW69470.1 hypothetical protein [Lentimicrobium sp.]
MKATTDLTLIFNHLRSLMKPYETGSVKARVDEEKRYDLWSEKKVVIEGRKRNDVYFAGLVIQRNYVGFYYMPVFVDEDLKAVFKPELLKLLKGKSCFHVKKMDDQLSEQISDALRSGYDLYLGRGWI